MNDRIMQERGLGLEKAFFARENERLRVRVGTGEDVNSKKALTPNFGITNDLVLDSLDALHVSPAVATAMSLLPLIGVAWADGKIQADERVAVLKAVE